MKENNLQSGGKGDAPDSPSAQPDAQSDKGAQNASADEVSMSLLQTLQSVLWAMLGVQKKRNANRDFTKGKASHFIIIGILFGAVFVITLIVLVKLILASVSGAG